MAAIRVELELADGTFTTRMLHAGETVERFNQNVARSNPTLNAMAQAGQSVVRSISLADTKTKSFMGTLRDVAIVTGLVSIGFAKVANIQNSWIGDIIRINAEMERLNFQMRSMSQAADPIKDAGDQVGYLRQKALEMPLSLKAITDGFVKLKATGTDPLNGSLESLADGVAAFGGSDESFQRAILAISQMSGKGVIQMEELRQQLGESMPRAVELMARSMGVSMAQLIKDISTGTMQAKPALAQFYAELERTYGGRARTMMQTFSGQLQQSATAIQTLATSGSLKNNFFEAVKDQLRDLNGFLNSRAASAFANDLGNGLASVVRYVRSAVDTLIEFRSEIFAVGQAAAGIFAFRAAISGISAFAGALGTLRTELRTASIAMTALTEQRVLLNIMLNSGAPAATVFAQRLAMVRTGLGAIAMGAVAVAPWLAALGLGAYAAAEYFGIFSNKVEDAYQSLVKYGAETRKQAQETTDAYLAQLDAEIELEKWREERRNKDTLGFILDKPEEGSDLQSLMERRAKIAESQSKLIAEAAAREDAKSLAKFRDGIDSRFSEVQLEYDREQEALRQKFDEEDKLSKDAEASAEKRRAAIFESQKKLYTSQIDILSGMIRNEQDAYASLDAAGKAQSEDRLKYLYQELRVRNEMLDSAKAGFVPLLKAPPSSETLYEKGQKALAKMRAEAEGLAGEFAGADKEVVELTALLRNGKYGDMGKAQVKALTDELIAATQAKENLDKLLAGKKKLDSDLESAMGKALDKEMELAERRAGRELTESEKIRIRIENGFYAGFGPGSQTKTMLQQIVAAFDTQGDAANQVGTVLRDNTFGQQTVNRIKTVTDALREMAGQITGIGTGLGSLDFGKISMPGDMFFGGSSAKIGGNAGTLLDLIAKVESGNNYNATLDNGKWTGGDLNLVGMTLKEILAVQQQMLANPENRATYGDGKGSSALGRYQITGATLRDLIEELGLSGEELYDKSMQDRLAMALIDRRSGQGVAGLRNEWEGLRNVDANTILQALAGQRYAPSARPTDSAATAAPAAIPTYAPSQASISLTEQWQALQAKAAASIKEIGELERKNALGEKDVKRLEANRELVAEIEAQKLNSDELNKNYERYVALIKQGKLGESKDPRADEYKELLKNAKELDAVEKEAADRKKALSKVNNAEEQFGQKQLDLTRRIAEANARITDPLEQKSSAAFRALRTELDEYLRDVESYYTRDSAQYKAAVDYKAQMLRQLQNTEISEKAATWRQDTINIQRSLMTERQQRTEAMRQQIAEIDRAVAEFKGGEEEKIRLVEAAEAKKAAIRAQYAREMSPFTAQMQEWGDITKSLGDSAKGWMDSIAGGMTDLIMGTGDLKTALNGIMRDLINQGLKWGFSQLMGGGKGQVGGAAQGGGGLKKLLAGGGGGSKAAGGGLKKFLTAHTGGVIGATDLATSMVSPGVFRNAMKMHTGGVIGRPLTPNEVPIIARKGEGVFTPEQMAAMGGGAGTRQEFNMPVSVQVNANGGTPEQNADLARQTARETKEAVRSVVIEEIANQSRQGGVLTGRGYK